MSVVTVGPVPLVGILLALGGSLVFSINDMAIKFLSGGYPLHQVVLVRAIIGLVFLTVLISLTGRNWRQLRTRRPRTHLLRVMVVVTSNATYFLGLAALPLADAVAMAFVAPVFITLLSIVMLREKVGPHRWAAVAAGLIGTFIMMRPGQDGIQPAAILILISALCYALGQLMARGMRETESAIALSFYIQVGFLVTSAGMGLWAGDGHMAGSADPSLTFLLRAWVMPPVSDWPIFLATGLAVAVGSLMIAQAYRTLEAAVVAPFEYAAVPMALLWGVLVFGTFPDTQGLIGMALIVGAGLYTLWRETIRRQAA
ncbi:EamA domain-containing membrane protein RarD [Gemmobacter megaterium]|uniref:EamA domain-containing membrane protein RarD n=1 Tax=Gemmobacter megaterium TaxID=1086013 RepID=A0A1N7PF49_9RHOB|nr:DMT family transporter [Gemmobacter megaterium]GGE18639.1 membrane protein [Gemmobacter megaterium]SIT09166.1 EamA domain-containing membrane protein RarD [Gemmobacter megaterium]